MEKMNAPATILQSLPDFIWRTRYRDNEANPPERELSDTFRRVARSAAASERDPAVWEERFMGLLGDLRFLPGGRILAGAGTARHVTLCNCFVMGPIEDSLDGIFDSLKEGALTMQQGGGVGYDFSTLRPRGARASSTGMIASGPVSFLYLWDAMCATILSTGARRGAMMATLRCDHPDIEAFIDAKRRPDLLSRFNLSVLLTDTFMNAVEENLPWSLIFGQVRKTLRARDLWARLCDSAYDCGEPGVLYIDRINSENNLNYCETLSATNPCAEEPLPPYGACTLGSVNLTAFVLDAYAPTARLDLPAIRETAALAVRFLDDVVDVSGYPLVRQREEAYRARRIGLGITGLADALAMIGLRYDSPAAREMASRTMCAIRDAGYEASIRLSEERGAFPAFDAPRYLERPFIRRLPPEIRDGIRRHGMRNSHVLAIAPAGTISLLAGNVSSGIEPIIGLEVRRHVLDPDGVRHEVRVEDFAYAAWCARASGEALPESLRDPQAVSARDQLLMQAELQTCVDGSISKTLMLPRDLPRTSVPDILRAAYDLGLKGCTVFRETSRAQVIQSATPADHERPAPGAHCCELEREND
ncbi:MAG TPA: adenosylcobalamin-dependent ribonucleoside-diphosphate reductase [Steroidobacteraceae bacterium]|nr:adenosylcobalamin-dependent ribonucleoside-diphosphate reductase [Steroidobacteraceae bacterium]